MVNINSGDLIALEALLTKAENNTDRPDLKKTYERPLDVIETVNCDENITHINILRS